MQLIEPVELEDVDLGDLTQSVGFMVRLAQVATYATFFRTLKDKTLKPGEFTVLWVIGLNAGIRQGTVAQTLKIKPAHMTKLVQRLVSAGFVDRKVPASDRRAVQLTLTDAGKAYCKKHHAAFVKVRNAERGALTDQETQDLLRLLEKLAFGGKADDLGR